MKSWITGHFDVVAATWLIILVFAWSIAMAAAAGSRPADWSGPLIGGVDWYSVTRDAVSAGGQSATAAQPAANTAGASATRP